MPKFGRESLAHLDTCCPHLQAAAMALIEAVDVSCTEGQRSNEDQARAFAAGASQLRAGQSKHNRTPSQAVHLMPYHPKHGRLVGSREQIEKIADTEGLIKFDAERWIREQYSYMAGRFIECGRWQGIEIRWGGDWDQDGDLLDNSFDDLAHFECMICS